MTRPRGRWKIQRVQGYSGQIRRLQADGGQIRHVQTDRWSNPTRPNWQLVNSTRPSRRSHRCAGSSWSRLEYSNRSRLRRGATSPRDRSYKSRDRSYTLCDAVEASSIGGGYEDVMSELAAESPGGGGGGGAGGVWSSFRAESQ